MTGNNLAEKLVKFFKNRYLKMKSFINLNFFLINLNLNGKNAINKVCKNLKF